MKLNFSNEEYKAKAKQSIGYEKATSEITLANAFMQLIKGVSIDDLSNLCEKIQKKLKGEGELTLEACYDITQGNVEGIDALVSILNGKSASEYILTLAYECLEKPEPGKCRHLGEKSINGGKINTSSWISHSLYEARVAQTLAVKMGLDPEKAGVMGILHDYGRKPTKEKPGGTHDFTHVVRGYEMLVDIGWEAEARASLTHSFINGGRCANCDSAEPEFYIDEKGNPMWEEGAELDDITEVLTSMKYDNYDTILNIADLMATDHGITTPYARVCDVATRKTPDEKNRAYFLSEFTNKLLDIMNSTASKSNTLMSIEEADERLKKISEVFYQYLYSEKGYKNERADKMVDTLEEI